MRKVLARFLQVLSWLVFIIIALALLIAAPLIVGCHPVVVLSGSMEPAYPVGSIIYYKSAAYENIRVGDAITFTIGDSLATHRVVQINEDDQSFVTQGDNNPSQDTDPISYDRVVGKASTFAIPYAGYFTKAIQHWYIIVILGVILLLNMILTPDEEPKKEKEQEMTFASFLGDDGTISISSPAASNSSAMGSGKDITAQEFFKDF